MTVSSPLKIIYVSLLLLVFGLIHVHAPLTVWLGSRFPVYDLLGKSWKEIILAVALLVGLVLLVRSGILKKLWHDRLFVAILAFALLHILSQLVIPTAPLPFLAGLMIDLRFLLFFVLVHVALQLWPDLRRYFVLVGVLMASVVVGFAFLQIFVLPKDILSYLGYSKATIAPYLTVDNNPAVVRINSTLRGPNPVGAFGGMVLAFVSAYVVTSRKRQAGLYWLAGLFAAGGALCVVASYSRSALVGAVIAIVVVITTKFAKRLSPKMWAAVGLGIIVITTGLFFALKDTTLVQRVILHDDPMTQSPVNSNQQHAESLSNGLIRLVSQPFGGGVGSTGSASLYGTSPVIIENQYLFVAHEVGWMGAALFLYIFATVLWRLWQKRRDWLALGVFASGLGLAFIGLLLPVWADDTISIVWWGWAAIALASSQSGIIKHHGKHAAKQKTT